MTIEETILEPETVKCQIYKQRESTSPDASASMLSTAALNGHPTSTRKRAQVDVPGDEHCKDAPVVKKVRMSDEQRVTVISEAVSTILECLEENSTREGLVKTPTRYAKALLALTGGYKLSPKLVLGDAEFDESHNEMVLMRDLDVFSLCEHHLLPFHGVCHLSYIPSGVVVGLSKLARIVEVFARRFQVQERLTTQIADAILEATNARGVMVYISCTHMCMAMRGVNKVGTKTITTAVRGSYAEQAGMRREFLQLVT